jgi:octaheme c-type cytochrome (tetrathionate reductase family)
MRRGISRIFLAAGVILLGFALITMLQISRQGLDTAFASGLAQTEPTAIPSMDHSLLPQLAGPFESAQEVTAVCLTCHKSTAQQVMATSHWTWQVEDQATGEMVGKYNIVNNYCINPQSNEPRCTSCHVGYGWTDNTFDFSIEENVDCLVCHDQTGNYKKYPTAAGLPAYEDTTWQGNPWPAVDLADAAQHVGLPTRDNCGTCHFYSGGGDAVKHGDLDSSMLEPDLSLDVHMSPDGANFQCQDCHVTEKHEISGTLYSQDLQDRMDCTDCHTDQPHNDAMMNMHTSTIACQTCHIPTFARGRTTKMTWDWSEAGQLNEEGQAFTIKDENGDVVYDSMKGSFTWEKDVVPQYIWWNGQVDYQTIGETIDPSQVVLINEMMGSREDKNARIYPVKVFQGSQPYDSVNNMLAVTALFPGGAGGENAYWKSWDWDLAIQAGMDYVGLNYSGEYDFVDTEMYWLITHQVAPAENALICTDCHSSEGRLDFIALGFSDEDAARLVNFPPGQPAEESSAEEQEAVEEATPTTVPTPQPTYEPKPTYAPPEYTLGEVTLDMGSGLTPLTWILIVAGALILVIVVSVFIFRKRG